MNRETWGSTRLKYVTEVNHAVLPESTSPETVFRYIDIGNVSQGFMESDVASIRFADAPSRARRIAEPGDTVVSTVRTYLRAVAPVPESSDSLVFSTGFAVLRPIASIVPRYLSWYLQGDEFISRVEASSVGVSYPAITATQLATLSLPLPPLDEQQAIADYLDCEARRIDELIAEQRGLIETLRERKIVLAEKVFGVHVGRESRLRWHLKDVDERAGMLASELPLLSVSIDWGVRRRRMGDSKQVEGDVARYKVARQGDIVLNRMRAFQGALGVATEDGVVSPDYSVIRTTENVHSTWLASVMRAPSFIGEIVSRIRGIGGVDSGVVRTPRLNFADLREIRVVVPDLNQQTADVATNLEQTSRIDALIAESEDLIALSQERRAALITAAVTGQIDVRTTT